MLYIHPEECIDCGACEPECPVTPIFPEQDVPEEWASYSKKNYEYCEGGEERVVAQGLRQLAQNLAVTSRAPDRDPFFCRRSHHGSSLCHVYWISLGAVSR